MTTRFFDYKECPICTNVEISLWDQVRDTLFLFKCGACGIIFRNRYKAGSSFGYEESTFENWKRDALRRYFGSDFSDPNLAALKESYREALMPLGTPEVSGRVLDLGCGGGLFLKLLNELEYDAQGLEPSELFRNFGRDYLKLNILDGDIYNYKNGLKFETVILNSVLEHLEDPIKALNEIRDNILNEGGNLIITVPNIFSLEYLTEGLSWHNFNEDHLWYFSEPSLLYVLNLVGFKNINIYKYHYELSAEMRNVQKYIEKVLGTNFNPYGGISIRCS